MRSQTCTQAFTSEGLTSYDFAFAIGGLWFLVSGLIAVELVSKRMRDRVRARIRPASVLTHVRNGYKGCWDGNQLDMEMLVQQFDLDDDAVMLVTDVHNFSPAPVLGATRVSLHVSPCPCPNRCPCPCPCACLFTCLCSSCMDGNSHVALFLLQAHRDLMKSLRRHYIKKDVRAWEDLLRTQADIKLERKYAEHKMMKQMDEGSDEPKMTSPNDLLSRSETKLADERDLSRTKSMRQSGKSAGSAFYEATKQRIHQSTKQKGLRWSQLFSLNDLPAKLGSSAEKIKKLQEQQEILLRRAIQENIDDQHGKNVKNVVHYKEPKEKEPKEKDEPPKFSSRRSRVFSKGTARDQPEPVGKPSHFLAMMEAGGAAAVKAKMKGNRPKGYLELNSPNWTPPTHFQAITAAGGNSALRSRCKSASGARPRHSRTDREEVEYKRTTQRGVGFADTAEDVASRDHWTHSSVTLRQSTGGSARKAPTPQPLCSSRSDPNLRDSNPNLAEASNETKWLSTSLTISERSKPRGKG